MERNARDNYEQPLGNYVKNSEVQHHEGDEEAVRCRMFPVALDSVLNVSCERRQYIGGVNAFGGARRNQEKEYNEKASPFDDRHQSDVGRAYSGIEDDGY